MTQSEVREALKPCPFCGAAMSRHADGSILHPGDGSGGDCLMSGQGYFPRQVGKWNTRSHPHAEIERLLTDVRASFWVGRSIHQGENEYLDEIWQRLTDGGSDAG